MDKEKDYDRLIDDNSTLSDKYGGHEGGNESGALLDRGGSKYGSNSL